MANEIEKVQNEVALVESGVNENGAMTEYKPYAPTIWNDGDMLEKAWKAAQQYPSQPGADATAAILYAAMGNAEKVAEHISSLKEKFPAWVAQTQQMTEQILSGTHPAFPSQR